MQQLSAAAVSAALLLLAVSGNTSGDVTSSRRRPRAADEPASKYLPPGAGTSGAGVREYLPPDAPPKEAAVAVTEAEAPAGGTTTAASTSAASEAGADEGSTTLAPKYLPPGPEYLPPDNEAGKTETADGGSPVDGGAKDTSEVARDELTGSEGEKTSEGRGGGESGKTTTPATEYLPPGPKYLPPGNDYLPPENVTEAAKEGTSSTEGPKLGEDSSEGTTEAKDESASEETATEKASSGDGGENNTQSPGPENLPPSGTYLPPDGKKPTGEADGNGKDTGGEIDSGKVPEGGGAAGARPAKRPAITNLPPGDRPQKMYLPPPNETVAKTGDDEGGEIASTSRAAAEEATTAAEKVEGSTEASNGGSTSGGYDLQPPASYLPPAPGAGASRKYVPPGGPATGSRYRGNKYLPPGGPASSSRKYLPPHSPRGSDQVVAAESRNTLVTVNPRDRTARARERLLKRGRATSSTRTTTTEKNYVDSPDDDEPSVEEKITPSQSTTTVKPPRGETDLTDSHHKHKKPRLHDQSVTKPHRQRYRSNVAGGKPVRRHDKSATSRGAGRVHVIFPRKPVQSQPPQKPPVLELIGLPEPAADSEDRVDVSTEVSQPDSSQEAVMVETSSPPAPDRDIHSTVPTRQSEKSRRRISPQRTPRVFDDYDEDYVWEQLDEDEAQPPLASNYFESRRSSPRRKSSPRIPRPRAAPTQVHLKKSALLPVTAEETGPVFGITETPIHAATFVSRTANPPSAVHTIRPTTKYRTKSRRARPAIRVPDAALDTTEFVSITPRPPPADQHTDNLPSRHQLKTEEAHSTYRASDTRLDGTQFGSSTPHPPAALHRASRLQTDQLNPGEALPRYNVNSAVFDPPVFVANTQQHSATPSHTSRPMNEYQLRPQEDRFTYSSTDSHIKTAGFTNGTPAPPTAVHSTSQPTIEYRPQAAEVQPTYRRTDALLQPPEFISNEPHQLTNPQVSSDPIKYQPQPDETLHTYIGTDAPLSLPRFVNKGPYDVTGAQDTNRPPAKYRLEAEEAPRGVAETHIGSAAIISTTLHPPTTIHQTSKDPSKYQPKTGTKITPRFHYHAHFRIQRSATPYIAVPESAENHKTDSRVRRSEHIQEQNVQPRESAANGNSLSLVQLLHSFFTANLQRNPELPTNQNIDSLPSATSRLPLDTSGIQSSTVPYQGLPSIYQLTPSSQQPSSSPYQVPVTAHQFSTNSHQLYHSSSVTQNLLPGTATAPVLLDGLHSTVKVSSLLDHDSKVGTRSSSRIQQPIHEDSYFTDSFQMEEQPSEQDTGPIPPNANGSNGTLSAQSVRNKPDSHRLPSPIKPPRRGYSCDASLVASTSNDSTVKLKKQPRDCRFGPHFPQRSLAVRLRPRITESAKRNETLEETTGSSFAAGELEASSEGTKDRRSSVQNQLSTKQSVSHSPVQDTSDKEADATTESAASKARPKVNTRLSALLLERSTSQRSRGSPGAEMGGTLQVQKNGKSAVDRKDDESRNVPLEASESQQYTNATTRKKLPVPRQRTPALQRRYGTSDRRAGQVGADADVVSQSKFGQAPGVNSEDGSVTEGSQMSARSTERSHWPFAALTRKRADSGEDVKKSNPALENSTKEARITSNSTRRTAAPRTETISIVGDSSYRGSGGRVETKDNVYGRRKLAAANSKPHARSQGGTKNRSLFDFVQDERSEISTVNSEVSENLEQVRPAVEKVRSDPYYVSQQVASVPGDQKSILDTDLYNKKSGHSSHFRINFRTSAAKTPRVPKLGTASRNVGDHSSEESAVTDTTYHSSILGERRPAVSSNAGFTDNDEYSQIRDFLNRFLPLILAEERQQRKEEHTDIQVLGKGRGDEQVAKVNLSRSSRRFPRLGHVWSDTEPEATYEAASLTIAPSVVALSPGGEGDRRPRGFETKHFVRELPTTRAGKQLFILNITEDELEADFQMQSDCDGRSIFDRSGSCRTSVKAEQWGDSRDGTVGQSSHVSRRFFHKKIAAHAKSDTQSGRNDASGRNPPTRFQMDTSQQSPWSDSGGATQELNSAVRSGQKVTAPSAETVTEAQSEASTVKPSAPEYYLPVESTASPSENVAQLVPPFPPSLPAPAVDSGFDLSSERADQFWDFFQQLPQSVQSALLSSDSRDSSVSSYYPSENAPDSRGSYSLLGQNSYRAEDTSEDRLNPPTNVFRLSQFQSPETSFPKGSNLPKITSASETNPATGFHASDILAPLPVQPSPVPAAFATEAKTAGSGERREQFSRAQQRFQTSDGSQTARASSNAPDMDFSTKFGTQYSANIEGGRIRFGLFFPSTVARPLS